MRQINSFCLLFYELFFFSFNKFIFLVKIEFSIFFFFVFWGQKTSKNHIQLIRLLLINEEKKHITFINQTTPCKEHTCQHGDWKAPMN